MDVNGLKPGMIKANVGNKCPCGCSEYHPEHFATLIWLCGAEVAYAPYPAEWGLGGQGEALIHVNPTPDECGYCIQCGAELRWDGTCGESLLEHHDEYGRNVTPHYTESDAALLQRAQYGELTCSCGWCRTYGDNPVWGEKKNTGERVLAKTWEESDETPAYADRVLMDVKYVRNRRCFCPVCGDLLGEGQAWKRSLICPTSIAS